ncbi:MAG: hypothetical protein ACI88G_001359 [Woeseiaceae bacterium]|jgi:hypothetical protein
MRNGSTSDERVSELNFGSMTSPNLKGLSISASGRIVLLWHRVALAISC